MMELHPLTEDVLDFDADGYAVAADGSPLLHRSKIGSVANSFDKKYLEGKGKSFEATMFPGEGERAYREGDTLVCYADFGILSGSAGYLLVRDRRVVAQRATIRS